MKNRARAVVELVPSGERWRADVSVLVAPTARTPGFSVACVVEADDPREALGRAMCRIGEQLQYPPLPA